MLTFTYIEENQFLRLLKLLIPTLLFPVLAAAQTALKQGDAVQNVQFSKVLNANRPLTNLKELSDDLVILDFFGTWCVPCIKALPTLTKLQEKFNQQVSIILVSNETEERLQKFIAARKDLRFPVVVDSENKITSLFQPPAYPYTVVLKNQQIIAITEATEITEADIAAWLNNKTVKEENSSGMPIEKTNYNQVMNVNTRSKNTLVKISQDFMYAAKTGENTAVFETQLKTIPYDDLVKLLVSDNEKKAFWINLYNGFVQALLKRNPESFKNRSAFFKGKQIDVAGLQLSLDDIEHGILRRSKIKWSAGYLNKLFPGKTEKKLRVAELDYRLHFALNCGAKSCPPVAFYNPENLDQQLDIATTAYLTGEAEYNQEENLVKLSAIMGWFRNDFGGKKGMIRLLKEKAIVPQEAKPKIKFKSYDWTLYLNNYQQ